MITSIMREDDILGINNPGRNSSLTEIALVNIRRYYKEKNIMAGKDIKYGVKARESILIGVKYTGRCGQGDPWAEGP